MCATLHGLRTLFYVTDAVIVSSLYFARLLIWTCNLSSAQGYLDLHTQKHFVLSWTIHDHIHWQALIQVLRHARVERLCCLWYYALLL